MGSSRGRSVTTILAAAVLCNCLIQQGKHVAAEGSGEPQFETQWPRALRRTSRSLLRGTADCPDGTVTDKYICNCEIVSWDDVRNLRQIVNDPSSMECEPMCSDELPERCTEQPVCPDGVLSTCVRNRCGAIVPFEIVQVIRGANCKFVKELGLLACSPLISIDQPTYDAVTKGVCTQSCKANSLACSFRARLGPAPGELGMNLEKEKKEEKEKDEDENSEESGVVANAVELDTGI